jgi:hypothetical protein
MIDEVLHEEGQTEAEKARKAAAQAQAKTEEGKGA